MEMVKAHQGCALPLGAARVTLVQPNKLWCSWLEKGALPQIEHCLLVRPCTPSLLSMERVTFFFMQRQHECSQDGMNGTDVKVDTDSLCILSPSHFPGGLRLERKGIGDHHRISIEHRVRTRTLVSLAFASGYVFLSVWIAMEIPLWNVGFPLADFISKTSGFCRQLLLPPQSRTGSFSVQPDPGALSLQGPRTSKWPLTEYKNPAGLVGLCASCSPGPDALFPEVALEDCHRLLSVTSSHS